MRSENTILQSFWRKALSVGIVVLFSISWLLQVMPASAALDVPQILLYQGKLTDASRITVDDGSYAMQFNMYTVSTAGTPVYVAAGTTGIPSTVAVTVTDGIFNVELGNATGTPATIAFADTLFDDNPALYLEVIIAGETLTPRRRITASAYAIQAGDADLLDSLNSSSTGCTSGCIVAADTNGVVTFTGTPQTNGVGGGSVYINPSTAAANYKLFGVGLAGSERFSVDEDGDTVVAGTLGVTGATTLSSTLGVTGATTLNSTLAVTGATTLNGNVTLGNAAADIITVTGTIAGASPFVFEGLTSNLNDTTFAITDPTATNTITFPDASGEVSLLGQTVNIATETDLIGGTNITLTGSTLNVDDVFLLNSGDTGTGVYTFTGLPTGTTLAGSSVYIHPESATAGYKLFGIGVGVVDKFSVDSYGNTLIAGTLGVTGATTLSSTLTVTGTTDLQANVADSTGDLTFADNVVVTGTTDFQGNISDSTGVLGLYDNVLVTGRLTVNDSGVISGLSVTNNVVTASKVAEFASSSITNGSIITLTNSNALGTGGLLEMVRNGSGAWLSMTDGLDTFGIYNNAGTPESAISANIGSLAIDSTNGKFYVKTTDILNTGWIEASLLGSTIDLTSEITGTLPIANGGTGATTLANLIALGTDTTGNYVASVTNGSGIAGGDGGTEGSALTLALGALTADWDQTGAFDIVLNNANSELKILGSAGGGFFGTLDAGALTGQHTYTLPDVTGTIVTTGDTGTVTGTMIVDGSVVIGTDTDLIGGTNITLTGSTLSVDDAFLLNSGDTGTGRYTFTGAPTGTTIADSSVYINPGGAQTADYKILGLAFDGFEKFSVDVFGNTAVAGTLGVTGATTLSSTLAVTNNTIATSNLSTISSTSLTSGDLLQLTSNNALFTGDALQITTIAGGSALNVAVGNVDFKDNVILGSSGTDDIDAKGEFISSLIPNVDDTYTLGTSTSRWADLYLGPQSLHIGTNGNNAVIGYNTTANYIEFDPDGDGGIPEIIMDDFGNLALGDLTPDARLDVGLVSSSATASVEKAVEVGFSDEGAISTGTDDSYGIYVGMTRVNATGGTVNTYGVNASINASDAGATSNAYAIRGSAIGAADANYGGYFSATSGTANYSIYTAGGRVHIEGDATATAPQTATTDGSLYVLGPIESDNILDIDGVGESAFAGSLTTSTGTWASAPSTPTFSGAGTSYSLGGNTTFTGTPASPGLNASVLAKASTALAPTSGNVTSVGTMSFITDDSIGNIDTTLANNVYGSWSVAQSEIASGNLVNLLAGASGQSVPSSAGDVTTAIGVRGLMQPDAGCDLNCLITSASGGEFSVDMASSAGNVTTAYGTNVYVGGTGTGVITTAYGSYNRVDTASQTIGGYFETRNATQGQKGISVDALYEGGGTLGLLYGTEITSGNSTTGTITDMQGIKSTVNNVSSGIVTTALGANLIIDNQTTGTITAGTGLLVSMINGNSGDIDTGTITTTKGSQIDIDFYKGVATDVFGTDINMTNTGGAWTNAYGMDILVNNDQKATTDMYGLRSISDYGTTAVATVTSLTGVSGKALISNANATATNATGVDGVADTNVLGGTITTAYGVRGRVLQTAAGNVDTAYGGSFVSSATGTSSFGVLGEASGAATSNYGGYFKALNGTTNNYAVYTDSGYVHIEGDGVVTAPTYSGVGTDGTLFVNGNVEIYNSSLCISDTITCASASGAVAGSIYAGGSINANNFDLAEMFVSSQFLLAGEIVTVSSSSDETVERATSGSSILGVISTEPGLVLGWGSDNQYPVGLVGRVPIKVSEENGPITIGDRIAMSSVDGVGMLATEPGEVVGIAMQASTGVPNDAIVTFIRPEYWNGNPTSTPSVSAQVASPIVQTNNVLVVNSNIISNIAQLNGFNWSVNETGVFTTEGSYNVGTKSYQNQIVTTHAVTGMEQYITLAGTSTFTTDTSFVNFEDIDPLFNDIIEAGTPLFVTATMSNGTGNVYITNKTMNGFTLNRDGGLGTEADWMVMAFRKGFAPTPIDPALVPAVAPADPLAQTTPATTPTPVPAPATSPVATTPNVPVADPVTTPTTAPTPTAVPVTATAPVTPPVSPVADPIVVQPTTPTPATAPATTPAPPVTPVADPVATSPTPAPTPAADPVATAPVAPAVDPAVATISPPVVPASASAPATSPVVPVI